MKPCDPLTRELLATGPWCRRPSPHALLQVDGPDAGDFLQRLCSQDVIALAAGTVLPAAFLDAKGKVVATCLVGRGGGGGFVLECQAAQADRLLALLERYHFSEKLQFRRAIGAAVERIAVVENEGRSAIAIDGDVTAIAFARRGVQFERWHAPSAAALPAIAGRELDDAHADAIRMGSGLVAVGLETEPSTLALEADLEDHCSSQKGCYTGQEIVARINTYGHTNRGLCLLHLAMGPAIAAPEPLHEPEDRIAVGRVMRAVVLVDRALRVGLGYLPRDFQTVGQRLLLADGSDVTVAGFAP